MKYTTVGKERDKILPVFGPYSKNLAGVSYIADKERGASVEFCGFLAQFRGKTELPCERYQCGYLPWQAESDLKKYTYRLELEWKDRVYADMTYEIKDDKTVYVTANIVNDTDYPQSLSLHYLVNKTLPNNIAVKTDGTVIDPLNYTEISCESQPNGLNPDGNLIGEEFSDEFFCGHALGKLFGKRAGDYAKYEIQKSGKLYIRAKGDGAVTLSGAACGEIELSDEFKIYEFSAEEGELCICCEKECRLLLDAIILGGEMPEFYTESYAPKVTNGNKSVILKYDGIKDAYGVKWSGEGAFIRELKTDAPEAFLPCKTNDHVSRIMGNSDGGHYTDIFIYPIYMAPHETKTERAVICVGEWTEVEKRLKEIELKTVLPVIKDKGEYGFSQRLIQAAFLTNVVFPIRCQGEFIRHFTPGKLWNSLYTWDTGFISLALADINPKFGEDLLNDYLTEKGNIHSTFVHHGSMVPVQAYVYKKLYETYNDKAFLKKYYSQLENYYDFYSGWDRRSKTRTKSGLIKTFGYFYNSGGWDDYPPQHHVHASHWTYEAIPVINTVMGINFARIMRHAAKLLGTDFSKYDEDIKLFSDALNRYSLDEETGYYSYLHETDEGYEIIRYADKSNYNMGLDGVYPLMAGMCSTEQKKDFADRIMSEDKMWTDIGISVVSQDAPYFSKRGYWNGSVWFPHQWFVFLGMLEEGFTDYAVKIAKTALMTFDCEAKISYRCYEHFMIENGRGAGWHAFGGLSGPIVNWYCCFYGKTGITLPVNLTLIFRTDGKVILEAEDGKPTSFIYTTDKAVAGVTVNGKAAEFKRVENAVIIPLCGDTRYEIEVKSE